jgi:hypothetical protein
MTPTKMTCAAVALLIALALGSGATAAEHKTAQPGFSSPTTPVAAMVGAMRPALPGALATIVGPGSQAWLLSGDEVADRAAMAKFVAAYDERHAIRLSGENRATVNVGADDWPLPIPLVRSGGSGASTAPPVTPKCSRAGSAATSSRRSRYWQAMADAQVEYARADPGRTGQVAYAQKFASSPGAHDGLYWPAQAASPRARSASSSRKRRARVTPSRSCAHTAATSFRMLKAQGPNARWRRIRVRRARAR